MIQQDGSVSSVLSTLKYSMLTIEQENEFFAEFEPPKEFHAGTLTSVLLKSNPQTPTTEVEKYFFEPDNGIMVQAERTARGFAKGRSRYQDKQFVDECIAEAWYVVTETLWMAYDEIKAKYPDKEERDRFFRMMVRYHLKSYWAYRSTGTISYLKKKGISVIHIPIEDSILYDNGFVLESKVALDNACANEVEKKMVEFYGMGNSREDIARKCCVSRRTVKLTLAKIKKRLKRREPICKPQSHVQIFLQPRMA